MFLQQNYPAELYPEFASISCYALSPNRIFPLPDILAYSISVPRHIIFLIYRCVCSVGSEGRERGGGMGGCQWLTYVIHILYVFIYTVYIYIYLHYKYCIAIYLNISLNTRELVVKTAKLIFLNHIYTVLYCMKVTFNKQCRQQSPVTGYPFKVKG